MESVLFVCTGNICRSPMAHVILVELLKNSGHEVVVTSAGVLNSGFSSTDEAIEVMRRRNLDLSSHLSTSLSEALAEPADLIVGMTGQHVREVVATKPELLSRTFTLKDLVRRADAEGPRPNGESLQAYAGRLSEERKTSEMMGRQDDVADPFGRGIDTYEQTAKEIHGLVAGLKVNLWP